MPENQTVQETKQKKKLKKDDVKQELVKPEIVRLIIDNYHKNIDSQMENLHTKMVAYISEAKVPLPQLILVLDMLKAEAVDMAFKKYLEDNN